MPAWIETERRSYSLGLIPLIYHDMEEAWMITVGSLLVTLTDASEFEKSRSGPAVMRVARMFVVALVDQILEAALLPPRSRQHHHLLHGQRATVPLWNKYTRNSVLHTLGPSPETDQKPFTRLAEKKALEQGRRGIF